MIFWAILNCHPDGPEATFFRSWLILAWALQLSFGYTQLMIIVGLCLDGGKSVTGQFLRWEIQSWGHLPVVNLATGWRVKIIKLIKENARFVIKAIQSK